MYAREQMRAIRQAALRTLPERSRTLVALYYVSEMTMKHIGDLFGMHETRVSQDHRSALDRLAAALESNGVHSRSALTV